ncbi:MAG: class I SAM-dependent methyltransferase [Pseudomonadota bacterium]
MQTPQARPQPSPDRILYDACPLCQSTNTAHLVTGACDRHACYDPSLSPTINWVKCADCSHVFAEGYYTDAALQVMFRKTQDSQVVGTNLEQNRAISARMIERVLPYQDSGAWLDVGFGNGSLLFTAAEFGFDTVGLDLRQTTVTAMQNIGFEAHLADICDFKDDRQMSVISMADVLEHTHFPVECLRAAHRLLKPGGVLFASMPNSDCMIWDVATQQNANPYWGEMEHYHNFSRQRLYALLEETGFVPKRYGISERYRMCMEVVAVATG